MPKTFKKNKHKRKNKTRKIKEIVIESNFESGNIIITGAKKVSNIMESYNYISKFMENNKQIIQKSKICEMLRDNISHELKEMIQIDDEEDLLALALKEVSV